MTALSLTCESPYLGNTAFILKQDPGHLIAMVLTNLLKIIQVIYTRFKQPVLLFQTRATSSRVLKITSHCQTPGAVAAPHLTAPAVTAPHRPPPPPPHPRGETHNREVRILRMKSPWNFIVGNFDWPLILFMFLVFKMAIFKALTWVTNFYAFIDDCKL